MRKLYQVAIVKHVFGGGPNDVCESVIYGPEWILAKNEESAKIRAIRDCKEDFDTDEAEVLVRPF